MDIVPFPVPKFVLTKIVFEQDKSSNKDGNGGTYSSFFTYNLQIEWPPTKRHMKNCYMILLKGRNLKLNDRGMRCQAG